MSHVPHELAEEFPELVNQIHRLRETDGHFHRITDEYHEVNRAIHRAETKIEPCDDFRMEEMRKQRMQLKDEIYGILTRPEPAAEDFG
ncbi:YdcH family protein [Oricola sp.]|uniref:YdcH family protein n=1 Tax=Oricola sp. TaxID=1979950 RepID=UPI003BAB6B6F